MIENQSEKIRQLSDALAEKGKPIEIMGFDIDVTDLIHAQNELEEKNKELEAYAFTVAHDLKAPLRRVKAFSELLFEEYSTKIDESANEYLSFIIKNVTNLGNLK